MNLCIHKGDSLECVTGCGPANPTVAVCDRKVYESNSCSRLKMSQLVFSTGWSPNKVHSNARMDVLAKRQQAGREQKLSPMALVTLPAEGMA